MRIYDVAMRDPVHEDGAAEQIAAIKVWIVTQYPNAHVVHHEDAYSRHYVAIANDQDLAHHLRYVVPTFFPSRPHGHTRRSRSEPPCPAPGLAPPEALVTPKKRLVGFYVRTEAGIDSGRLHTISDARRWLRTSKRVQACQACKAACVVKIMPSDTSAEILVEKWERARTRWHKVN